MSLDSDDEQRVELGARLRDAREYLGFSQEEVATKLGLSRTAVTHIEAGSRRVEALELERLSKLYGRSVAFLLSGKEQVDVVDEQVAFAARALKGLSVGDLEQVVRFASYLRSSARNPPRKGR